MSRTYRRQKGDRRFVKGHDNVNNPWWGRSPFHIIVEYHEVVERTRVWTSNYTYYTRVNHTSKAVKKYVPAEPRESVGVNTEWVAKMQRDGVHGGSKWVKEYSRPKRRSEQKRELSRLKKLNDYDDMQYIDATPVIGDWWYWF